MSQQHSGKGALRLKQIIFWLVVSVTLAKSAKSCARRVQQVPSLEIYSGTGNCFQKTRSVDARKENSRHCALEWVAAYLLRKEISASRCVGLLLFTKSIGMNVKQILLTLFLILPEENHIFSTSQKGLPLKFLLFLVSRWTVCLLTILQPIIKTGKILKKQN